MQLQDLFNFNRKLADRLVPYLARTPLTPNHVTTMAMLAGISSGALMSCGSRPAMLAGAACLQLSLVLDNCDGAIARIKNLKSRFGKWYDLIADLIVDFSLWTGLGIAAAGQGVPARTAALLAAVACIGVVINFFRVISEEVKQKAQGPLVSTRTNPVVKAFDELCHDGDPTLFVWLLALWANPYAFLWLGAVYMHLLWAGALILNIV